MTSELTPQERFDQLYITSTEITKELKVDRSAVHNARKRNLLPEPIVIPGARISIWERDKVQEHLDAWKIALASRRHEL